MASAGKLLGGSSKSDDNGCGAASDHAVIIAPEGFDEERRHLLARIVQQMVTPDVEVTGPTPSGMIRLRVKSSAQCAHITELIDRIRARAAQMHLNVLVVGEDSKHAFPAAPKAKGKAAFAALAHGPDFGEEFELLGVSLAWSRTQGDPVVAVAIIDEGMFLEHPLLKPNIRINTAEAGGSRNRDDDLSGVLDDVYGADFSGSGPSGVAYVNSPQELPKHGTSTGFIAAGITSGTECSGVAPGARLIPVKFTDGNSWRDFDLARSIEYATVVGASIINASLQLEAPVPATRRAIAYAAEHDVLIVASAGDTAGDLMTNKAYPAALALADPVPNQIVVMSFIENFLATQTFSKEYVDVGAPIGGLVPGKIGAPPDREDGSSISAPYVAGAAALLKSLNREWWTYDRLRTHVVESGTPQPNLANTCKSGKSLHIGNAVLGPLEISAPPAGIAWDSARQESLRWQFRYPCSCCAQLVVEYRIEGFSSWHEIARESGNSLHAQLSLATFANSHGHVRLRSVGSNFLSPEVPVAIR